MSGSVSQSVEFAAPAAKIYEILTNGDEFAKVTGAPAQIANEVGGSISLFGGMVEGENLVLETNRKVVQIWGPSGLKSKVSFSLTEKNGSTTLDFEHTDFPVEKQEHFVEAWPQRYWNPIKEYLAK